MDPSLLTEYQACIDEVAKRVKEGHDPMRGVHVLLKPFWALPLHDAYKSEYAKALLPFLNATLLSTEHTFNESMLAPLVDACMDVCTPKEMCGVVIKTMQLLSHPKAGNTSMLCTINDYVSKNRSAFQSNIPDEITMAYLSSESFIKLAMDLAVDLTKKNEDPSYVVGHISFGLEGASAQERKSLYLSVVVPALNGVLGTTGHTDREDELIELVSDCIKVCTMEDSGIPELVKLAMRVCTDEAVKNELFEFLRAKEPEFQEIEATKRVKVDE